jgi:hypothetical protein
MEIFGEICYPKLDHLVKVWGCLEAFCSRNLVSPKIEWLIPNQVWVSALERR